MARFDELPPRLRAPLQQLVALLATSLWIGPAVASIAAAALAFILVALDPPMGWLPVQLEAAAARAGLTSVVTTMVAAISLVGTGTIVALQLAAMQYSPRLLRDVLEARGIQLSLSGLVGAVVYALAVQSQASGDDLPTAAALLGLLLGMVGVGLLVLFIHQVATHVRLETILHNVTDDALSAVEATHPEGAGDVAPEAPDDAERLMARRSGYLEAVSLDAIARAAAAHGAHVRLRLPVGEFLVRGTTMAWAWPAEDDPDRPRTALDELASAVDHALALGVDRTIGGDPAYGLRHLVDIGLRGISPAVNDPTTASQCIHSATPVLVGLAQCPLVDDVVTHDGCQAVLPRQDYADHLDLAQSQLLQYGGHDVRVMEALAQQLRDLAEATSVDRELLRSHLDRLRADAEDRDHRPHDRALLHAALDRVHQALAGSTREDDPSAG